MVPIWYLVYSVASLVSHVFSLFGSDRSSAAIWHSFRTVRNFFLVAVSYHCIFFAIALIAGLFRLFPIGAFSNQ